MTRKTTSSKRSGSSRSTLTSNRDVSIEKHLPKMNEIHSELRKLVNTFLEERNVPLKVHAMHFASTAAEESKCCIINGKVVCGPQCF